MCIAEAEDHFASCMRILLRSYPDRLSIGPKGGPSDQITFSVKGLIGASSKDSLLDNIIDQRVDTVMRMKPSEYLQYLRKILHSTINEESIKKFSEIAATRDLVIHTNGKITPEYIAKSGKYARGKLGQTLAIDKSYFEQSIKAIDAVYGHIDAALLAQGQKDSRITDEVIRLLRDNFFERFFS